MKYNLFAKAVFLFLATLLIFFTLKANQTGYADSPGPFILVSMNGNFVYAYQWPVGTLITITIDDPSNGVGVDYTDTSISLPTPMLRPEAFFGLADRITVKPGFIVNATDGTSSRSLVVANFYVTSIDQNANTISGIGTPGVTVRVCPDEPVGDCLYAIVDNEGKWSAPPYSPYTFKLVPGLNGWTTESDSDGDETYNHWVVFDYVYLPFMARP